MRLLTLGDSHAIYSFAGVAEAKIYHACTITMHRAARDGIWSVVPSNCKFKTGDFVILSFGEIDGRAHIKRVAIRNGRSIVEEVDDLCARFAVALKKFEKTCPAKIVLSCIVPYQPHYLDNGTDDDIETRIREAKVIQDRMNHHLSKMGYPFIDFRKYFANPDGSMVFTMGDFRSHIDSRQSLPVVDEIRKTLNIDVSFAEPPWPAKPRREPLPAKKRLWHFCKEIIKLPEKILLRPIKRAIRKKRGNTPKARR